MGKIGVSIYETKDIEMLLENNYEFDLIQLPLNVLDQTILNKGLLRVLKERNDEIHVRSVFLQGLLLAPLDSIPPKIEAHIAPYFKFLAEKRLTKLEGALRFISTIKEVDYIVLGVNTLQQLKEIYEAFEKVNRNTDIMDFKNFSV